MLTKVFGKSFNGLIDSGAMATIIGRSLAEHLEENNIKPCFRTLPLQMANGFKSKVSKVYKFSCKIGGVPTSVEALYLPSLTTEMVIGMDLISELRLITVNRPSTNLDHEIIQGRQQPMKSTSIPRSKRLQPREQILNDPSCVILEEPGLQLDVIASLRSEEQTCLTKFLANELPLFENVSGRTTLVEHKIRLKDDEPIKQRHYHLNPAMRKIVDDELDAMLRDDVIEPSKSAWSSPIVLAKKSSGKYRFCVDMRRVNASSKKDAYPLPKINAILENLKDAKYMSTIDLKNGYWQVPLAEESKPITAFTVPGRGLFQFKVMAFGLHSAPATFQRLLDRVIGPELEPRVFAYLDDLIVTSATFNEHLDLLKLVFKKLRDAGLKINREKCQFCRTELKYLGHVVNSQGINTDPEKVRAVTEFPTPTCVRSLRSFLGLASWYRRFVPDFAKISAPLTKLLKKTVRWNWTEVQDQAMSLLKSRLTTAPTLVCPNFLIPFEVHVDASNEGLGAALIQKPDGKEIVVAYASRLLSEGEKKFSATEKECLGLVWALQKFRPYLEGYHFIAVTDHQALRWLMKLPEPSGRLGRWVLKLQQFDFEIQYRKGALNKVADALSRHPVTEIENTRQSSQNSYKNAKNELDVNVISDMGLPPSEVRSVELHRDWYEDMVSKVSTKPEKYQLYQISEDQKLIRKASRSKKKPCFDPTTEWKMCVPPDMRQEVLQEIHDRAEAGHFGIRKSLSRCGLRYYWPGWQSDVRNYVKKCLECQKYKVEQKKPYGKMYFRKPKGPWILVTGDLIGPLPRSKKGNRYAVVFQDYFTKWVEIAPLRAATAQQVEQKFRELILLRYGAPEVLRCDNGSQFTANLFHAVAKYWGIRIEFTAPYSPQSNPTERYNRVLKTMIAQFTRDDHRTWDQYLSEFRFAMNSAEHESTSFSPGLLNTGRELKAPKAIHGSLEEEDNDQTEKSSEELIPVHHTRINEIRERVKKNLAKAFHRQAKYYNLRRRESPFEVDSQVLKRQHTLSSAPDAYASKLAPKFAGPYTISRKLGANMYELQDAATKTTLVAHAKDLKLFV